MKNQEAIAFDLWRNQRPASFKRIVMLTVYSLVAEKHNQTDAKILFELRKRLPNASEEDFLDAIASLKQFDAIGLFQIKGKGTKGNAAFHVNAARSEKWVQYLQYIEDNFPHLSERK
jgi:hypothetical protein